MKPIRTLEQWNALAWYSPEKLASHVARALERVARVCVHWSYRLNMAPLTFIAGDSEQAAIAEPKVPRVVIGHWN
jgi:hypothetical protein